MANRVHILPDEIANRIAAGEVVERPASVTKELVENAVDAGADRIVVEAGAGGKESLRISDNGCGMSRDDALLALERHATSKIHDLADLRELKTHGFRGEALPSVAAVSRMVIETRQPDDLEGTRVDVVGGRVRDVTSVGRSPGTTITLHGLFFNVPARRKFLKGVDTEFRHIANTMTAMGLAYPNIAFELKHNGRDSLRLPRADRTKRVEQVFNVKFGKDVVEVSGQENQIGIWGFVARPETARKSGQQQMLIVNQRWVQHKAVTYAVYEGFGGLLPKGLTPAYCLFLNVDPSRVDVNVHPSKREIRFADERAVYQGVVSTVHDALRQADLVPEIDANTVSAMPTMPSVGDVSLVSAEKQDASEVAEEPFQDYQPAQSEIETTPQMALPLTVRHRPQVAPGGQTTTVSRDVFDEADFGQVSVWQLHHKYVLAHIKNGMIVVDQQVAHQRVLYERALSHFDKSPATSQRLLFPQTLDFGLKEIHFVREAMPLLERMGFGIRDFGGNTVVIDAIPVGLKAWQEGHLLRELIQDIADAEKRTSVPPGLQARQVTLQEHRLAASYAWHTSIREGDELSTVEMRGLIDQLFATQEPFVCPYGRPTLVKMGLDELSNRFRR
ncbi:MAG: DNA mismatch repair endonuclease MutL [Candidatus Latescibacteria bacterium]|jgi:DNA mismatch repair protein MutL|nr:DNA mismatch repair endonuclease MutL [Candidatus Latescibacterota bacterium]MBT5831555.1 DNA mismatch repair endonuclease MutL [Candidatus Latescibacterota bacterium]